MKKTNAILALLLSMSIILAGCGTMQPTEPPATPTIDTSQTAPPSPTRSPAGEKDYSTPGDYFGKVMSDKKGRTFKLHVPPSYQPGTPMPLVMSFHGAGSNSFDQASITNFSDLADRAGFIVVYPNAIGTPPTWDIGAQPQSASDVQFVRDLIAHLEEKLDIDPRRIYATGLSNGGGMANRLACDLSDKIAAIGPVAGAFYRWQECEPSHPISVIAFHGTEDPVILYMGEKNEEGADLPPIQDWAAAWATRNECDPEPVSAVKSESTTTKTWENCSGGTSVTLYTIAGGGHTWASPRFGTVFTDIDATAIIWDFFKAHPMP
jgi:polyhydroxybutyrate depolymerase